MLIPMGKATFSTALALRSAIWPCTGHRAGHGIYRAGELDQDAVARVLTMRPWRALRGCLYVIAPFEVVSKKRSQQPP
jgi:hypothetical protein